RQLLVEARQRGVILRERLGALSLRIEQPSLHLIFSAALLVINALRRLALTGLVRFRDAAPSPLVPSLESGFLCPKCCCRLIELFREVRFVSRDVVLESLLR